MFKICECCGLPIVGDSWYVALYKDDINKAAPNELCKECKIKISNMLKGSKEKTRNGQMVLKTDRTILTRTGFVKVIRSILEGDTLQEIVDYYHIEPDVITNAVLPIYSELKRNPNMTNEDILRLRPKRVRKYNIAYYRFSDDSTRNMQDFIVLYKRGTWSLLEISRNLQIPMFKIDEFLRFYVNTDVGRVDMMETACTRYDNGQSVEVISKEMGVQIDTVLDYLSLKTLQFVKLIPAGTYKDIVNMYNNLHMSTSSIAGALGCSYDWVVYTLNDWRLPSGLNRNKMEESV